MTPDQAGILLVDKAQGWTSHDVAAYLRGVLKIKTGHGGTLDPMATGLLIILLGRATKMQDSFQKMPKAYSAEAALGAETDTWDAEGQITQTLPIKNITIEDIKAAAQKLTGDITHPVPFYSAKKVGGVAMYKAARAGNNIVRESAVHVYEWTNIAMPAPDKITFDVRCGSGTYIRSLAFMLGRALGTAAHLSALRRTSAGGFDVKDAINIETLKKMTKEEILKHIVIPEGFYRESGCKV